MKVHLAILRGAACLVPNEQRAEWLAEWRAELWHVRRHCARQMTAFCLGAFRDALWLRRNGPPNALPMRRPESPARCLGFLGLLAAVCPLLALRFHPPECPLLPIGQPVLTMLFMAAAAQPALLATTSLRLGEYPGNHSGRRWLFLLGKIALVLPIIFCAGLVLGSILGAVVGVDCMVAGYVVAFRWALIDQRQRCPECLRLLAHPAPVGQPSQTFLEWYGTEFVCVKGHGLLHVPEIPTVSFRTQRWRELDRSWSTLFS